MFKIFTATNIMIRAFFKNREILLGVMGVIFYPHLLLAVIFTFVVDGMTLDDYIDLSKIN
jgi:hypothetical protein